MATLNLGRIKPVFRDAWSSSTTYVVDDIVTHSDETFICILGNSNQATSNATYWKKLAAKGTDLTSTLTTEGDIVYRDGSGLQRLAKGTAGQALKMNSGATAPEWGTIASGTYSVHRVDSYIEQTGYTSGATTDYFDISNGKSVSFQPTSTDDMIYLSLVCPTYQSNNTMGCDAYFMMKEASDVIGSGDTKLNYDGQHAWYISATSWYTVLSKSMILPCTGLNTSSTYYIEVAAAAHTSSSIQFNYQSSNGTGTYRALNCNLIHYKKN